MGYTPPQGKPAVDIWQAPVKRTMLFSGAPNTAAGNTSYAVSPLFLNLPVGKYIIDELMAQENASDPFLRIQLLVDGVEIAKTEDFGSVCCGFNFTPALGAPMGFGIRAGVRGYMEPIYVEGALQVKAYSTNSMRAFRGRVRELV